MMISQISLYYFIQIKKKLPEIFSTFTQRCLLYMHDLSLVTQKTD